MGWARCAVSVPARWIHSLNNAVATVRSAIWTTSVCAWIHGASTSGSSRPSSAPAPWTVSPCRTSPSTRRERGYSTNCLTRCKARSSRHGTRNWPSTTCSAASRNRRRSRTGARSAPCPSTTDWKANGRRWGLFLTGHPVDEYLAEIRRICRTPIATLRPADANQTAAGVVVSNRTRRGRRGAMGFVEIDDKSGRIEANLFGEVYDRYRAKLEKHAILVIEGTVQSDEFTQGHKLRAERVLTLEEARNRHAGRIVLSITRQATNTETVADLKTILGRHRNADGCSVTIDYSGAGAYGCVLLGDVWRVDGHGRAARGVARNLRRGCRRSGLWFLTTASTGASPPSEFLTLFSIGHGPRAACGSRSAVGSTPPFCCTPCAPFRAPWRSTSTMAWIPRHRSGSGTARRSRANSASGSSRVRCAWIRMATVNKRRGRHAIRYSVN